MDTSIASQSRLLDLSDKFNGKIPVRIFFLDNSSKLFLIDETIELKDIIFMILSKYCIKDIESIIPYFTIAISNNGTNIDKILGMNDRIIHTVTSFKSDNTKLVFMIKLFSSINRGLEIENNVANRINKSKDVISIEYYLENAETTDSNLLYLQYIQAVYHVITGHTPTTAEQALLLGSYHFLYKFGEYNEETHHSGFLGNRILEYIPSKHLKSRSIDSWELSLLEKVKQLYGTKTIEINGIQRLYMNIIYSLDTFGMAYFKCTQCCTRSLPDTIVIAINISGISFYDKARKLLKVVYIEELISWGFIGEEKFYFVSNLCSKDFGCDSFECLTTNNGKSIAELLTDYAIILMKEKGLFEINDRNNSNNNNNNNSNNSNHDKLLPKSQQGNNMTPQKLQAIIKLQAIYRGYALRRDWINEDAAILIQSMFRGYRARVKVIAMIEELLASGEFEIDN